MTKTDGWGSISGMKKCFEEMFSSVVCIYHVQRPSKLTETDILKKKYGMINYTPIVLVFNMQSPLNPFGISGVV